VIGFIFLVWFFLVLVLVFVFLVFLLPLNRKKKKKKKKKKKNSCIAVRLATTVTIPPVAALLVPGSVYTLIVEGNVATESDPNPIDPVSARLVVDAKYKQITYAEPGHLRFINAVAGTENSFIVYLNGLAATGAVAFAEDSDYVPIPAGTNLTVTLRVAPVTSPTQPIVAGFTPVITVRPGELYTVIAAGSEDNIRAGIVIGAQRSVLAIGTDVGPGTNPPPVHADADADAQADLASKFQAGLGLGVGGAGSDGGDFGANGGGGGDAQLAARAPVPGAGKALVRFINTVDESPAYDLALAGGGDPLATNVTYLGCGGGGSSGGSGGADVQGGAPCISYSAWAEVSAPASGRAVTLIIVPSSLSTVVATVAVNVSAGAVITVAAMGPQGAVFGKAWDDAHYPGNTGGGGGTDKTLVFGVAAGAFAVGVVLAAVISYLVLGSHRRGGRADADDLDREDEIERARSVQASLLGNDAYAPSEGSQRRRRRKSGYGTNQ
jgi:uncharacterized membrane protein